MSAYILMIGLVVNGEVLPVRELSGVPFQNHLECETTVNHPMVRASYESAFPDHEVRFWCEPVGMPHSVSAALRMRKNNPPPPPIISEPATTPNNDAAEEMSVLN